MEEIRYEILQLKEEFKGRRFMGLRELAQTGLSVSAEQYNRAYSGVCPPDVPLDDIYARFNHDRPDDFHGWSLSVGDIILLHRTDGDHAYFVDSIGFQELKDFLLPQNRMLVTVRNASRDEQNFAEYNYVYCYQREALDRALTEMQNARAQAYVPVYRHTAAYAREAGELDAWRASHRENVACRTAIDEAISKHYDGMHLDKQAVRSVLDTYGAERMAYVLANTVVMKEHDGRFSRDNRAWAQAENIPIDRTDFGYVHNDEYVSQSHSTILNGYIGMARREMEASGIEKSAVIAVPAAPDKTVRRSVRSQLHEKRGQARPAGQELQQPARKPRRESR